MKLAAVPGIEVNVCISNTAQKEYDDENADSKTNDYTGVKYIEAVSSSSFTIAIHVVKAEVVSNKSDELMCKVSFDGNLACAKVLYVNGASSYVHHIKGRSSWIDGQHVSQDFSFHDLSTSKCHGLQNFEPDSNVCSRRRAGRQSTAC